MSAPTNIEQIAAKLEAAFGAPFKHEGSSRPNAYAGSCELHEFSSDGQVSAIAVWVDIEDRSAVAREVARMAAPDLECAA